jgi:tetratricopeptide (TPR) repeat protein
MVSKSVLPHPSLRYSQNLQWSASQGIRTATVETGFNWIWRDLQLSGRSQTAAQGAKPASQVDLKLNYHFQDTSVSWSYFRTAGPRPEPAAGPPAPGAEQGAPANPDRLRGDQLRAQGQYVEAIEVYQQALTRGAEEGKAYLGMGQCYWHLGDFQSAIDQYEEVLLHDPNESEAYLGLGASYRALGDHEKAISYLQELLKRAPGSVWGRVELGLAQRSLGEPEAALQTLREAIRTAPRMWQPRYYLAETCFQSGDPEACQGVLREALELPLDKEAVNQILTLLARAGGLPAQ